jgi:hypothetical protein
MRVANHDATKCFLLSLRSNLSGTLAKTVQPKTRKSDESGADDVVRSTLHFAEIMGGWAKNIAVIEGKYIDTTMTPSPKTKRYFGWFVPCQSLHH